MGSLREIDRLDRADQEHFFPWFRRQEPVVLTGLGIEPAAWTPEKIVERCGQVRVRICTHEVATELDPMGWTEEVTVADYFGHHFGAGKAMRIMGAAVSQLEGKDVICQQCGIDAVCPSGLVQARSLFYASAAGGVVPLHFDVDSAHIFLIQAHGHRQVRLFAPSQSRNLYKYPFRPEPSVALDSTDLRRFPRLGKLKGYQCRLAPGEILYMPARYWHLVEYTEPSCGMSVRYRKAGLEGQARAWYGKKVASFDHGMRSGSWGGVWADLMSVLARL